MTFDDLVKKLQNNWLECRVKFQVRQKSIKVSQSQCDLEHFSKIIWPGQRWGLMGKGVGEMGKRCMGVGVGEVGKCMEVGVGRWGRGAWGWEWGRWGRAAWMWEWGRWGRGAWGWEWVGWWMVDGGGGDCDMVTGCMWKGVGKGGIH
jgi:hypothetical protein